MSTGQSCQVLVWRTLRNIVMNGVSTWAFLGPSVEILNLQISEKYLQLLKWYGLIFTQMSSDHLLNSSWVKNILHDTRHLSHNDYHVSFFVKIIYSEILPSFFYIRILKIVSGERILCRNTCHLQPLDKDIL